MERGIIVNDGTPHVKRVKAGVQWLRSKGGGTVYIPLWRDFETYFGEPRRTGEARLLRMGIRVERMDRHMYPHGDILVLYPDSGQMEQIEEEERDGATMVVEWNPKWLDSWRSHFEVTEYRVETERS